MGHPVVWTTTISCCVKERRLQWRHNRTKPHAHVYRTIRSKVQASAKMGELLVSLLLPLLSVLSTTAAAPFTLTILHTNDMHARFVETDENGGFLCLPGEKCFGGIARRASAIARVRSEDANVVLLDGGDVFTGTPWYSVFRGNATSTFMNELRYDAMVSDAESER